MRIAWLDQIVGWSVVILLHLYISFQALSIWRVRRSCHRYTWACKHICTLKHGLKQRKSPQSLEFSALQKVVDARRVQRFGQLLYILQHFSASYLFYAVVCPLFSEDTTGRPYLVGKQNQNWSFELVEFNALALFLGLVLLVRPRYQSVRALNIIYTLWMGLVIGTLPSGRRSAIVQDGLRFVFSLIQPHLSLVCVMNIVFSVVRFTLDVEMVDNQYTQEVIVTVMVMLCAYIISFRDFINARMILSVNAAKGGENRLKALLSVVCDAIIFLDDSLEVREHSPQLAAMLSSNPSQTDFAGHSFVDLVSERDRAPLAELASRGAEMALESRKSANCHTYESHSENNPAQALHVHLTKEDTGQQVGMQLYVVSYCDYLDRPFHLVGVQELGEMASPHIPKQQKLCRQGTEDSKYTNDSTHMSLTSLVVSESGSAKSDESDSSSGGIGSVEEVFVAFEVAASSLEITNCSLAFTYFVGPEPCGRCLLPHLSCADGFLQVVQNMANSVLHSMESEDIKLQVKLSPPGAKAIGISYTAMCLLHMHIEDVDGVESMDDVGVVATASFYHIKQHKPSQRARALRLGFSRSRTTSSRGSGVPRAASQGLSGLNSVRGGVDRAPAGLAVDQSKDESTRRCFVEFKELISVKSFCSDQEHFKSSL